MQSMEEMLFDTHAHFSLDAEEVKGDLERAREAGVGAIMAVGGDEELNAAALLACNLAAENPLTMPKVFRALGYDRDQAAKETLAPISYEGVVAVGEIGLDYHYEGAPRSVQCDFFCSQLEKASSLGLPVVIHTREADDDTLAILRHIPSRGIIHSFTGNPRFCRALLDEGFFISFSGIATFRAADNVRESLAIVPDDRILVETDAPFLAPVPLRGKRNESAFVVHTANFIAALRGMEAPAFARLTTANAFKALAL